MLSTEGITIGNVTFEPGCRNNWHIHHKVDKSLLVTAGEGYYQAWGEPARKLTKGDVVHNQQKSNIGMVLQKIAGLHI